MKENKVYLIAIIVTISVIIINQIFIQYWLFTKKEDAKVINVGGRQRMLSQRLLALTYDYRNNPESIGKQKIKEVQEQWSDAHEFLIEIFKGKMFPNATNLSVIDRLEQLTPVLQKGIENSKNPELLSSSELKLFLENQEYFLKEMNATVNLLEADSSRKLRMIVRIEIIFALLSLLLIFYEIFFIFRKINQKLKHQNASLAESNLLLEQYAFLAAHDLRAPIQNVINFAKLLKKTLQKHLGKEEEQYFKYLLKSAENSKDTTSDLLAFSTINNQKIEPHTLNTNELIQDVLSDLKTKIEESSCEIKIGQLPNNIVGDKQLLHLVFQNLISNAIKFVPKGQTPQINIQYHKTEQYHLFDIQDNGVGISQKNHAKVFGLFKRLHHRQDYAGTGIGLSICEKIISKHKGKISLVSEVGKGSTFTVALPL